MSNLKEKTEASLSRRIEIYEAIMLAMRSSKWSGGFRKPGSRNPKKGSSTGLKPKVH